MQHFTLATRSFPRSLAALILAPLGVLGFSADPLAAQAGTVTDSLRIGPEVGGFGGVLAPLDAFGFGATSIGDLDGDGVVDLAVGAPGDSETALRAGTVWILFMQADGTVKSERKISNGEGGLAIPSNSNFGTSVTDLGDLDGDGVVDLAVGTTGISNGGGNAGGVWILFLNTDGSVRDSQLISHGNGGFPGSLQGGDAFGSGVDGLGDLDGDGVFDLAVGCDHRDAGATDAGATWVLLLNADGTVKAAQEIANGLGGFVGSLDASDFFGSSVSALGDLDSDGVTDLAVGADGDRDVQPVSGAVWILFLNADGTVKAEQKISATAGGFGGTLPILAQFGSALEVLPDLNGDGVVDLGVGAFAQGSMRSGTVWILFLRSDGIVAGEVEFGNGLGGLGQQLNAEDQFGGSLAFVGDLGGDGNIELLIGSAGFDDGNQTLNGGAAYVVSLCDSDLVAEFSATPTSGSNPLTVAFQDQSVGAGPLTWDWNFGDGSSSSLQNPVKTFALPGTFTVELRVDGAAGACGNTKANLITVDASPAGATKRNGTGVNPDVFATITLPILGTTWSSAVDAAQVGASGLTILIGYAGSLTGFPSPFGEILIDPFSSFVASDIGFILAGQALHDIAIPNDLVLEGFPVYTQVLLNGMGQLTNALDLILGF